MPTLRARLVAFLVTIFGRLSVGWTPPVWLAAFVRRAAPAFARVGAWLRRPKVALSAAGLVVVVVAAVVAYELWPKPVEPLKLSVAITNPSAPPRRTARDPEPAPDSVHVRFGGSAAPLELVGKSVTAGIRIEPAVAGEWSWTSDTELTFSPREHWPVGQTYEVTLDETLVAEHVRLERRELEFATPAFEATLAEVEFYQDPVDPKVKQVVVTVRCNYPVDPESLEKRLSMSLLGAEGGRETKLPFTVTYDDLEFEAYLRSQNVPIPLEDQNVRVTLAAGVRAARGGPPTRAEGQREVRIPGRYNLFRIQDAQLTLVRDAQYEPQQVLVLGCTSGVLESKLSENLDAYLLPVDKPAMKGAPAQTSYFWGSPAEIGPEVLAKSAKLSLAPIPAEREHATQHTFGVSVPPARFVYVRVKKGVEAYGGYILARDFDTILQVPPYPKEVRIMHEGAVLSVSGERRLNLLARGVKAVRIELARVLPTEINHLLSQSSGDFRSPYFRNYGFDEQNISEVFTEIRKLDDSDAKRAQYTAVDFGRYVDGGDGGPNRGLFLLRVQAWDPEQGRPQELTTTYQTYRPASRGGGLGDEGDDHDEGDEGDEDGSEVEGAESESVEEYAGEGEDEGYEGEEGEGYEGREGGSGVRYDQASDRRFVLLTDLGVLVKSDAEQNQLVFVQSIHTGEPVGEATVDVLGKNGLPVLSRRTDSDGVASFPSLADFQAEKQPVAYVVRRGGDLSFLPIDRHDRLLNVSRFDVDGVRTRGQSGALGAYLFSDRGLYRPGDTLHVGVIVKAVDWARPVANVPLQLSIQDPRGLEVKRQRSTLPDSGFVEMQYAPEESAPTGTYTVQAHIVQDEARKIFLGSTTVRVEEFLPDRLRISARVGEQRGQGWVAPSDLSARVELHNLFGTPAAGHRVAADMTLQPRYPSFPGYAEYVFYDPRRAERSYEEHLGEAETDDEGVATFDLDLSSFANATYELRFFAEGYELEGGRGVTAESSIVVSPLAYLVGYKRDTGLDYLKKGAAHAVELIAVGPDLKRRSVDGLTALLIEQRYVSVLVRQDNGTYKYQSVLKDITKSRAPLTIAAAGSRYTLPTSEPGDFVVSIRDASDTELTRVRFSVAGVANLTRQLERNAELEVRLDRRDYAVDDTIEVQIRAPYTGAGLLTIERDRVYAYKWFRATSTASVQTIAVPGGLEANAYVSVAFVRALDSPEIFMSPLSYGVVPFSVSRERRTLDIDIEVPERHRPGEPLAITYRTDRPAKIVVFAVDEGILQVAGYQTPDPLGSFLSKRALEVSTRQILDLILPELSVAMAASKTGGDEGEALLGKNLNPFRRKEEKPVVYWSGIRDAAPEPRRLTYDVPDYFNGSLRWMAVAVAADALGTTAKRTVVRGPFVLSPIVPLFVGPGDSFEATVAVANNVEGSGQKVRVEVATIPNGSLEIVGDAVQHLEIPEGREAAVRLRVRAGAEPGAASLTFVAKGAGATSKRVATTSVRPATPYVTSLAAGTLQDDTIELPVSRRLYPQYRRLEITLSPLPLALARGLASFLEKYPYACTEQLVSRSVPALVFQNRRGLALEPDRAKEMVRYAIEVLQARQNGEGAFGFWAAGGHVSNYASVYATQFLTEAGERGYAVPKELRERALSYAREVARAPLRSLAAARERAYAIYVLARNGKLATNELAELREYVGREHKTTFATDIAAAYVAATYRLIRDGDQADKMIRKLELATAVTNDAESLYGLDAYLGQLLYVVARHFPERLEALEAPVLERLVRGIREGDYTTISAAFALYGLDAYAGAVDVPDAGALAQVKLEEVRGKDEVVPLSLPAGLFPLVTFSEKATSLRLRSKAALPVFYAMTVAGFDAAAPRDALKHELELIHTFVDADGKEVRAAHLGQELSVHIKIRTTENQRVENVAVVDVLPAGFEVVIGRGEQPGILGRIAQSGTTWQPDYADVREDRVVLYGTVTPKLQELVYRIKATNRGEFVVPPAFAEAMYDRSTQARSTGGTIAVIGEE